MVWENRDREAFYRQEERAKGVQREKRGPCKHNQSLQLVGNFIVCQCGRKFIYRLKG